jgi:hypothetical protein
LLQSELIAKCEAEFEEILRQRKAQGLAPLTPEQANRIRQVIIARRAAMLRMRAGRQRNGSRLLPVGMTVLVVVLVLSLAALGTVLRP